MIEQLHSAESKAFKEAVFDTFYATFKNEIVDLECTDTISFDPDRRPSAIMARNEIRIPLLKHAYLFGRLASPSVSTFYLHRYLRTCTITHDNSCNYLSIEHLCKIFYPARLQKGSSPDGGMSTFHALLYILTNDLALLTKVPTEIIIHDDSDFRDNIPAFWDRDDRMEIRNFYGRCLPLLLNSLERKVASIEINSAMFSLFDGTDIGIDEGSFASIIITPSTEETFAIVRYKNKGELRYELLKKRDNTSDFTLSNIERLVVTSSSDQVAGETIDECENQFITSVRAVLAQGVVVVVRMKHDDCV